MKVAIASEGGYVAQHFGKCQEYAIFDVVNGKAENFTYIPSPGHQPGFLPKYLASLNVNCIIAGGMGQKALALFAENNIKPIVGVSGQIEQVVNDFTGGKLESGKSLCTHGEGHGDGHHQGGCGDHHC